jgi:hypothetical protein
MTPEHHAEAILRAAGMSPEEARRFTNVPSVLSAVREAMEAERKAVVEYLRLYFNSGPYADAIELGRHLPTPPRGE